ncbi:MAG TPA: glycerophosphodiester phosphodiesterase [Acidimicrobiales bacterium]|nr:glycerophosphodiester phosphodiesterase [Acidimicrobiales bacterium]
MTSSPARSAPSLYGHRGASADAPENTLAAFALARAQGADGVELDVRRSADGDLVLHHDPAFADGRVVVETPTAELPEGVPTLVAALDELAWLVVNIEIKNSPFEPDHDPAATIADDVVALLHERGGADRALVSSFDLATIDRVRAIDPAIPTGFLTFIHPIGAESIELAADRGHVAIHPHEATIDAAFVELAHGAGLEVVAWTVDAPDRLRALADAGVDAIITNVPGKAREALRARPG